MNEQTEQAKTVLPSSLENDFEKLLDRPLLRLHNATPSDLEQLIAKSPHKRPTCPEGCKIDVSKMLALREIIVQHAEQFYMEAWFCRKLSPHEKPWVSSCGTAGCIAGWWSAAFENAGDLNQAVEQGDCFDSDKNRCTLPVRCAADLSLPNGRLFSLQCWPNDLYRAYHNAKTPTDIVAVVSDVFDRYISTCGEWRLISGTSVPTDVAADSATASPETSQPNFGD